MKIKNHFLALTFFATLLTSCATVESGHQGVEVSYGGAVNMEEVLPEGMDVGLHWMWDDVVEYNAREQTLVYTNEFLDFDGLSIPVETILYFSIKDKSANAIHKGFGENYIEAQVEPKLKAALKNVVPKYKALELNVSKRELADQELAAFLEESLAEVFVDFQGVTITDVDIPKEISAMIVAKQKQDESNLLAEKKKVEKVNLAAALIAEKKGEYEAAQYEAKTKDIMSQPKMLELKRLEVWEKYAASGASPYGSNNVFGSSVSILRGLDSK